MGRLLHLIDVTVTSLTGIYRQLPEDTRSASILNMLSNLSAPTIRWPPRSSQNARIQNLQSAAFVLKQSQQQPCSNLAKLAQLKPVLTVLLSSNAQQPLVEMFSVLICLKQELSIKVRMDLKSATPDWSNENLSPYALNLWKSILIVQADISNWNKCITNAREMYLKKECDFEEIAAMCKVCQSLEANLAILFECFVRAKFDCKFKLQQVPAMLTQEDVQNLNGTHGCCGTKHSKSN